MEGIVYIFTGGEGDVWDKYGKITLKKDISQEELKRLHDIGSDSAIKVEKPKT